MHRQRVPFVYAIIVESLLTPLAREIEVIQVDAPVRRQIARRFEHLRTHIAGIIPLIGMYTLLMFLECFQQRELLATNIAFIRVSFMRSSMLAQRSFMFKSYRTFVAFEFFLIRMRYLM